jgi:Divergent InlB B-repeat domain
MKRSYIGLAMGALVMVAALLAFPSCGFNKRLVSITVQPPSYTFLDNVSKDTTNFKAYGTYIHPPSYEDITTKVTWGVDVNWLTIASGPTVGGTVTTQGTCGISDVSATAPEGTGGASNIVVGYGSVIVNDPNNPICPGGSTTQAVVTVTLAGPSGAGSVTSVPAGISCPSGACGAQFTVGTPMVLTATPTPNTAHTFVGWSGGCTSVSGTTCSIQVPTGSTNAIATFN